MKRLLSCGGKLCKKPKKTVGGLLKIIFAMMLVGTNVSILQSVKIISNASAQNFFMVT